MENNKILCLNRKDAQYGTQQENGVQGKFYNIYDLYVEESKQELNELSFQLFNKIIMDLSAAM